MSVRREAVRLELEDHFTREVLQAAAATGVLNKALNNLDGTNVRTSRSTDDVDRSITGLSSSSRRGGADINNLSGRLSLLARAAAVAGPALLPIGSIGVAAVAGLASQLGFAAIGMGTLVAASQGVGDALTAVNKAALEPTAANLEAAREAMANLGPHAQAFVERFQNLRPVLADIRDAAAAGWFPGLTDALDSFEQVAPKIAQIFGAIGTAGGNLVADAAEALAGPEWREFLNFVQREAPPALDALGRSVGNVVAGMADLWMAFAPLNRDFNGWLLDASRSFADWADGLSETQGFQEFIAYIRDNGPLVAEMASSIGNMLLQIAQAAAPLGGPVLQAITAVADAIAAIADSPLGTPIMAGVTALSALSLSSTIAAASLTRLSAAMGAVGATSMASSLSGLAASAGPAGAVLATLTYEFIALQSAIETTNDSSASFGEKAQSWFEFAGPTFWALDELGLGLGDVGDEAKITGGTLARGAKSLDLWKWSSRQAARATREHAASVRGATRWLVRMREQVANQRETMRGAIQSFKTFDQSVGDSEVSLRQWLRQIRRQAAALRAFERNAQRAGQNGLNRGLIQYLKKAGVEGALRMRQLANASESGIARANRSWRSWRSATDDAMQSIDDVPERLRKIGNTPANPTIDAKTEPFESKRRQTMADLQAMDAMRVQAEIDADTSSANGAIAALKQSLSAIPDETVNVYVNRVNKKADGGLIEGYANGGRIRGQRYPYGDKVNVFAAPGEYMVSNRYGQVDRNLALLQAINANRGSERAVSAGSVGGGAGRQVVEIRVTADDMDLTKAKAQIHAVVAAVTDDRIDVARTWDETQRGRK